MILQRLYLLRDFAVTSDGNCEHNILWEIVSDSFFVRLVIDFVGQDTSRGKFAHIRNHDGLTCRA
jgi:hypothetical protein